MPARQFDVGGPSSSYCCPLGVVVGRRGNPRVITVITRGFLRIPPDFHTERYLMRYDFSGAACLVLTFRASSSLTSEPGGTSFIFKSRS